MPGIVVANFSSDAIQEWISDTSLCETPPFNHYTAEKSIFQYKT